MLLRQSELRFGALLPAGVVNRVKAAAPDPLLARRDRILTATSPDDALTESRRER